MKLTSEQEKFAYGKYEFIDSIRNILAFMDPVSKFDTKIEEFKNKNVTIIPRIIIFLFIAVIFGIIAIYGSEIFSKFSNKDILGETSLYLTLGAIILAFILIAASKMIFVRKIKYDVDNDLNNFIIPFLNKIKKYVPEEQIIKVSTNLGPKIDNNYVISTGTYSDTCVIPWFSSEIKIVDDIKVFINLSDIIRCYGKLKNTCNEKSFDSINLKVEMRFIFPKNKNYNKIDYIGADYIVDWEEMDDQVTLTIKTIEDCAIEFYYPSKRSLGVTFDNDICIDIIDEIYAKLTGNTSYIENNYYQEPEEQKEQIDYEAIEINANKKIRNLENEVGEQAKEKALNVDEKEEVKNI